MKSIYKKELRSFFATLPGYLFITFVLLLIGVYCVVYNLTELYTSFEYVINGVSFIFALVIPIVTMRVFVEEKRQKTDQLLFTLPLNSVEIVLGKYFALLTVLLIPIAVMSLYPLLLSFYGEVDLLTAYSSIVGFFLLGAVLCSIGMFVSSLTENQLVAALICFAILLVCYRIPVYAEELSPSAMFSFYAFTVLLILFGVFLLMMTKNIIVAAVPVILLEIPMIILYNKNLMLFTSAFPNMLLSLALFDRLSVFTNGLFDLSTVIYYVSIAGLFVFFTVRVLDQRRWN